MRMMKVTKMKVMMKKKTKMTKDRMEDLWIYYVNSDEAAEVSRLELDYDIFSNINR